MLVGQEVTPTKNLEASSGCSAAGIGAAAGAEAMLLTEKNELETARLLLEGDIESHLSVWSTTSLYYGYTVLPYLYKGLRDFQQAGDAVEQAMQLVITQRLYLRNRSRYRPA